MKFNRLIFFVSIVLFCGISCAPKPKLEVPEAYKKGQNVFHKICSNCHGSDGMGKHTKAPRLIDEEYLAPNFTDDDLAYANKHLLIFSGLYGVLKPMDLIQPYRLEIATKFSIDNHKDLYSYWIDIITAELNEIFSNENNPVMINLASNEYFKSFSKKDLNAKIITPVFKEYKQGNYKIVSIYAKRARGLLSAYLIKNKIDQIDDIKSFDEEGYIYNNSLSGTNEIVFTRR